VIFSAPDVIAAKNAMQDKAVVSNADPTMRMVIICTRKAGPAPVYLPCATVAAISCHKSNNADQPYAGQPTEADGSPGSSYPGPPISWLSSTFTAECLFQSDATNSQNYFIAQLTNDDTAALLQLSIQLSMVGVLVRILAEDGKGGTMSVTKTYTPKPGPQHVCATYDGATLRLFLAGVLQGSTATAAFAMDFTTAATNRFRLEVDAYSNDSHPALVGAWRVSPTVDYPSGGFTPPSAPVLLTGTLFFFPTNEPSGDLCYDAVSGAALASPHSPLLRDWFDS